MREGAKKRLVGAVVIVALAVIFVPMLFEDKAVAPLPPLPDVMPQQPELDERFREEAYLTPSGSIAGIPGEGSWAETQDLPPPAVEEAGPVYEGMVDEPMPPSEPPAREIPGSTVAPDVPPETATLSSVPEPVGHDDGMPSWVIQVASLGTQEGGEKLADKLRREGYSAFVEPAEVRGRVYYRVRVGPELDRARAEQTAERLRQSYKDALIQRYP